MANIEIDLNLLNPAYLPQLRDESRHLVNVGGAGSGKSYFSADKFIFTMIGAPGHRLFAFRKIQRTLKESVWRLLLARLSFWGVYDLCKFNKTDLTIEFINGSMILCNGLDDPEKLKSVFDMTGAWLEEPTECTPDDLFQVDLRLRGETPGYKQIMYSLNPISVMHHIKHRLVDNPPPSCTVYHTTYHDNRYIDPEYERVIESYKDFAPNKYRVYALGEWGVLEGLIYNPFTYLDKYPEIFDSECYGIDFGFNNPMAVVHIGELDDEYYLTELIYRSGMTGSDLIAEMNDLEIPKGAVIKCDQAKPDTIEELVRAGWWGAKACEKGRGSVEAGIDFIQAKKIYTRSENININREMQSYEWRTNREGKPMDEPVKLHDHAMDAIRYGMWGTYGRPTMKLETFDRTTMGI